MAKRKPPSKEYLALSERRASRKAREAGIIADLQAGKLTQVEIAAKYKVPQSRVSRIAVTKNIDSTGRGRPQKTKHPREAEIIADLQAKYLTQSEIAAKYDIRQSQVSRIGAREGIKSRGRGRLRQTSLVLPTTVFQIDRAAAPIASGFPWSDMRPGDSVFVPRAKSAAVLAELLDHPGFASEVEDSGVRIKRNG